MAYKRIIASLFIKEGLLVKSYGYRSWKPAGSLNVALKHLELWGADEILIIDISRKSDLDKSVLNLIKKSKVISPIIYGGGIRSLEDASRAFSSGVDRVLVENLLGSPNVIQELSQKYGSQAIIASVPVMISPHSYSGGVKIQDLKNYLNKIAGFGHSEILLTCIDSEGGLVDFSAELCSCLADLKTPNGIICFGGLDSPISSKLLELRSVVAVAFGNSNYIYELNIHRLREEISSPTLRRFKLV